MNNRGFPFIILIGKGDLKERYHSTRKAALIGIISGIVIETIFASISTYLLKVFTNDQELIHTVMIILFIDIALEVGRAGNLVYGHTLKQE